MKNCPRSRPSKNPFGQVRQTKSPSDYKLHWGNLVIEYDLIIEAKEDNLAAAETLSVNDVQLISTRNGKRWVQDEDRQKAIECKSNILAVSAVGDYRNEPITKALARSIQDWHIYDFRPDLIRRGLAETSVR